MRFRNHSIYVHRRWLIVVAMLLLGGSGVLAQPDQLSSGTSNRSSFPDLQKHDQPIFPLTDISHIRQIAGIRVVGAMKLSDQFIVDLTGLKVGDRIRVPGIHTQRAMQKLWSLGLLENVRIEVTKQIEEYIFIDIIVKEVPRISKINVAGIPRRERYEVEKITKEIVGKGALPHVLHACTRELGDYNDEKGFQHDWISYEMVSDSSLKDHVQVNYTLRTGHKRVKVDNIEVNLGRDPVLTERKVKKLMYETKPARWYYIMQPSWIRPDKLEVDLERIRNHYRAKGYLDVQVSSNASEFLKRFKGIHYEVNDLEIDIDHGPLYRFGEIRFTGNHQYTSTELQEMLDINEGDVYNAALLHQNLHFNGEGTDISSMYMDQGYLFMQIEPVQTNLDPNEHRIDLEIRIREGLPAYVGEVQIEGNTVTRDHVIRRELYTIPGDLFSRAKLFRSQQALGRLNYFKNETMSATPIPNQETGLVDLVYHLEDKPTYRMTVAGAWNASQGLVGTLGLQYNNFALRNLFRFKEYKPLPSGYGQQLSIDAQANGVNYQNYAIRFTEPWLGGKKPNGLTVALNQSVLKATNDTSTGSLRITGAKVALSKRFRTNKAMLYWNNSIGYNLYELSGATQLPLIEDTTEYQVSNTSFNKLHFTSSLSASSLNDFVFPSRGSAFNLDVTFTPPYSLFSNKITNSTPVKDKYKWLEYHKWTASYEKAIPLMGKKAIERWKNGEGQPAKWVWYNQASAGLIGSFSSKVGSGPFNRFVMGGTNNFGLSSTAVLLGQDYVALRGYENNSSLLNQFPTQFSSGIPVGGIAYGKFTSELRRKLLSTPVASVYALGFFEAGNNFHSYGEIQNKWFASAGVGARLYVPAFGGTIGIDFGRPLFGNGKTWIPQFTIGN